MNGSTGIEPGHRDRRIDVIMHFMTMSEQFRAHRRAVTGLMRTGEVANLDLECLLEAIIAELGRLADARSAGRFSQGAVGYGTQQMRDLLHELLACELTDSAKRRIRHFLIDHLEVGLLDFPGMRFTQDWFSVHEQHWSRHFSHLAGRAGLRFLEIGSFEGRSACWLLTNLLRGPECLLVCVDTFDAYPGQESTYDHNIRACGAGNRVVKLRGRSDHVLPSLEAASFDFIYVDGSHQMLDVLKDAAAAWRLARPGGVLVFDDYRVSAGEPADGSCGAGVDGFLAAVPDHYDVIFCDWQLAVRKTETAEPFRSLPASREAAGPSSALSREGGGESRVKPGF